jgi:SAM-dependent methyltransferase
MTKKHDPFIDYASYHTISDFTDLSIADIITLQFLTRYSNPVVRHTLFNEVKQFIEFKEKIVEIEDKSLPTPASEKFYNFINLSKKLSTGSFYYSLDKLEKRGLLTSNGKTGKVSINPTKFTKYVPQLLLKFLINNNIMDSNEYRDDFFKKILSKIENSHFDRILSIWLSEYVPLSIANQLSDFTKEMYILSKNEIDKSKNYKNRVKYRYTEIIGGLFREREDFFDASFIPVYKKNPKFYNMTRNKILKEIIRVTKPNGYIILVSIADIEISENIFINELIKLYKAAYINRTFTVEELHKDMSEVGLNKIDVFEHQGFLIGIAKIPS